MAIRLPLDANLIGYWGLDETLETDNAIDETTNALNLTVTSASSVSLGRVGNARGFNGTSSFASLTSATLRLTGDLTLIGWFKINTFNATGSTLRTIVSCGGPTTGDNSLYALHVELNGALSYRHTSASGEVIVKTAGALVKAGQFYFVSVRRVANGGNQDIEIYLDNVLRTPASVTVNGVPQSLPVPPPAANASAVFSLGRSQRQTDSAFWDGLLDEISVHNTARPYHAYLIEAYFRAALRASTTKLTSTNTVVAVSSAEMGSGVRWWCFERDKDLFVVKESPFGLFGPETSLTTVGTPNASLNQKPELVYDAPNDTLYVFFVSGNRIYKITANSTDDPATINMPYTADTGTIIKSLDNVDAGRIGEGGSQTQVRDTDFTYVNRTPVKLTFQDVGSLGEGGSLSWTVTEGSPNTPSIVFAVVNGVFGVLVGPFDSETNGYNVYILQGGAPVLLSSTPTQMVVSNTGFYAVGTRVFGQRYYAQARNPNGLATDVFSDTIVDFFGTIFDTPTNGQYQMGNNGDLSDVAVVSEGGSHHQVLDTDFTYVNRAPVKFAAQDPDNNILSEGCSQKGTVTVGSTNRPVDAGKVLNLV